MAFYSIYKWFSPWSKREYTDIIYWYKEYVLKTPEQREQEKKDRQRKARIVVAQLLGIFDAYSGLGR